MLLNVLKRHAPLKGKVVRANRAPYMNYYWKYLKNKTTEKKTIKAFVVSYVRKNGNS